MIELPAVFPADPPRHCPHLILVFVGGDAEARLRAQCTLIVYGDFVSAIAWIDTYLDPALFRWPVRGKHVAIDGALPPRKLRGLLAALMRDGALVAAGVDTDGNLHTVSDRTREAAA